MVHIQKCALSAFAKYGFARTDQLVEPCRGIDDERLDVPAVLRVRLADRLRIDRLRILERLQHPVLIGDLSPDFLRQCIRTDQIADPQSAPRHLVFVSRAYTAGRRSDAPLPEMVFDGRLEYAVIGKNQVTSIRYEKAALDRHLHRRLNRL